MRNKTVTVRANVLSEYINDVNVGIIEFDDLLVKRIEEARKAFHAVKETCGEPFAIVFWDKACEFDFLDDKKELPRVGKRPNALKFEEAQMTMSQLYITKDGVYWESTIKHTDVPVSVELTWDELKELKVLK